MGVGAETAVEFGILGPLSATVTGASVPIGPGKHRILLACLLGLGEPGHSVR